MRGVVIVSGVAYGGGGLALLLLGSPRDEAGHLIMLGSGRQHWSTVHVADLAEIFRRVLESDSMRGRYIVGDGTSPSSLKQPLSRRAQRVRSPVPTTRRARRLGDYLAEALLLDQRTDAAKARSDLG